MVTAIGVRKTVGRAVRYVCERITFRKTRAKVGTLIEQGRAWDTRETFRRGRNTEILAGFMQHSPLVQGRALRSLDATRRADIINSMAVQVKEERGNATTLVKVLLRTGADALASASGRIHALAGESIATYIADRRAWDFIRTFFFSTVHGQRNELLDYFLRLEDASLQVLALMSDLEIAQLASKKVRVLELVATKGGRRFSLRAPNIFSLTAAFGNGNVTIAKVLYEMEAGTAATIVKKMPADIRHLVFSAQIKTYTSLGSLHYSYASLGEKHHLLAALPDRMVADLKLNVPGAN